MITPREAASNSKATHGGRLTAQSTTLSEEESQIDLQEQALEDLANTTNNETDPQQKKTKQLKTRPLALRTAFQKYEESGIEFKQIRSDLEEAEMAYTKAKFVYWAPRVSLSYKYGFNHTLKRYKGSFPDVGSSRDYVASPTENKLDINLFSYDIYAGGIPSLNLETAWREYQFAVSRIKQKRENLKRQLIQKYFAAKISKSAHQAALRGIEMWKNIKKTYEIINKSGQSRQNNTESGTSDIEIEINDAEQTAQDKLREYEDAETELNLLLGEQSDTKYAYVTKLKFQPLNLQLKNVIDQINEASPQALEVKNKLELQRISSQKLRLEKLTRPTISFSGLNLSYRFSKNSTQFTGLQNSLTTSDSESSNINLSMAFEFNMNILGESGFFNHLEAEEETRLIRSLENEVNSKRRESIKEGITTYKRLSDTKRTRKRAERSLRLSISILDGFLEKISSGEKISNSDLKNSVINSTDRIIDALKAKKSELDDRLALDELMGTDTVKLLEDIPDESSK